MYSILHSQISELIGRQLATTLTLSWCVCLGYFKENILLHFIASMISGLITTAASMPVDIAKTRFDYTPILYIF